MKSCYLTVAQVARALGLWRSGVYQAIQEGRLSHVKIAGRIFVTRDAMKEWQKARKKRKKS